MGKHINWRHLPVVMVCDVVCIKSKCNGGVSEEWESCKVISLSAFTATESRSLIGAELSRMRPVAAETGAAQKKRGMEGNPHVDRSCRL